MALLVKVKISKNLNHILRLRDILIHVDPLPLVGSTKFFKFEYSGELKEGDIIIKVEFLGSTAYVLSWKLCYNGKGTFELGLCKLQ
jgi:hypothetical protein